VGKVFIFAALAMILCACSGNSLDCGNSINPTLCQTCTDALMASNPELSKAKAMIECFRI
jgi:hypothetical protein